jgi:hypothetical protein
VARRYLRTERRVGAHPSSYVEERETEVVGGGPVPVHTLNPIATVMALLGLLWLAIEGLLTLRFLFLAFGASPASGFVDFIYDVSWPFVRPFDGAFANRTWDEGVVEVNTLLAMFVWMLIFGLLALLVRALAPYARTTAYPAAHAHEETHAVDEL